MKKESKAFAHYILPHTGRVDGHNFFSPVCFGHENNRKHTYAWDNRYRNLSSPTFCIQYTIDGEGFFQDSKGNMHKVKRGDVMFLMEPENQRYSLPKHSRFWEVLFFSFNGSAANQIFKGLSEKYGELVSVHEHNEIIKRIWDFYSFAQTSESMISDPYFASAKSYEFVMLFYSELRFGNSGTGRILSPADRACSYYSRNISAKIEVEDIAKLLAMSRSHFTRVFKKEMKISPMQYLFQLRMNHAESLLSSKMPTKEIAMACGFENQSHFCRKFKEFHGMSTGEFRESLLTKNKQRS